MGLSLPISNFSVTQPIFSAAAPAGSHTFDSGSEDPNIRRPLKAARDIRYAVEDALAPAKRDAQSPQA